MFVQSSSSWSRAMILWAAVSSLVAGCASSPTQPKFTHTMVADSRVAASDSVEVVITTAEHIAVLPAERDRVAKKIKMKIDERKLKNPAAPSPRAIQVVLNVTRYEKGNAFARAMLAGLGQIHLEGTISVYQMPDHVLLEDFDMQKTFAWGGIYGAATSMEQIEDTFTDGVAATVTGQTETPPKQDANAHKSTN